jgi:hypothetical protein
VTRAEIEGRLKYFGASDQDVRNTIDAIHKLEAYGANSIYCVVEGKSPYDNADQYETVVLRVTWCRKQVPGPPTPLHDKALPIVWLGVTANMAP